MVNVHIDGEHAVFEVLGWHQVWALRTRVTVQLRNVYSVRHHPTLKLGWWVGWRMPGTHIPGILIAGKFYRDGEKHFWDVSNARNAIEVVLVSEEFDRLFVEVEDPGETVARLNAALHPVTQ